MVLRDGGRSLSPLPSNNDHLSDTIKSHPDRLQRVICHDGCPFVATLFVRFFATRFVTLSAPRSRRTTGGGVRTKIVAKKRTNNVADYNYL